MLKVTDPEAGAVFEPLSVGDDGVISQVKATAKGFGLSIRHTRILPGFGEQSAVTIRFNGAGVFVGTGVALGGTGVFVRVAVGGIGVLVRVLVGVFVGTGVLVGVLVGTGVLVGVNVGPPGV